MTQGLSGSCRDIKSCMDEVVRSQQPCCAAAVPNGVSFSITSDEV